MTQGPAHAYRGDARAARAAADAVVEAATDLGEFHAGVGDRELPPLAWPPAMPLACGTPVRPRDDSLAGSP